MNGTSSKFSRRSGNPAGAANELVLSMEVGKRNGSASLDLTFCDPTGWEERAGTERAALALLGQETARFHRPDSFGNFDTRSKLACEFGGNPEDWVLCASTSEAYSILFQLLADPGDRIGVCRPSYPLLDDLARHGGVGLVDIPLRWNQERWFLDLGHLERAMKDGIRCFALIQPGNPTGWWLSEEERSKVLALSARYGCPLVSDEVFAMDLHAPGFRSLHGEDSALVFVLQGLSKSFGLPQFKLGWIHFSGPATELSACRERLERLNDALLSASTPSQVAYPGLRAMQEQLRGPLESRLRRNRERFGRLSREGCTALPVPAGWMGIIRLGYLDETLVCKKLMEAGVVVQPGFLYDMPWDSLVVSLLTDPDVFSSGLQAIESVIRDIS